MELGRAPLTATSTMSAAMMLSPSRPLRMVRSSRVDQPPVSGVPVAGATRYHKAPNVSHVQR